MQDHKMWAAIIEDACWNEVNSWDIDTLIQYAYDSLADYYLRSADEEEVENFISSTERGD